MTKISRHFYLKAEAIFDPSAASDVDNYFPSKRCKCCPNYETVGSLK